MKDVRDEGGFEGRIYARTYQKGFFPLGIVIFNTNRLDGLAKVYDSLSVLIHVERIHYNGAIVRAASYCLTRAVD